MRRIEFETRIGGIPSIVIAIIHPEEGDGWHNPRIPAHLDDLQVFNMRGNRCKWRESRLTDADYDRIEAEAIENYKKQKELV